MDFITENIAIGNTLDAMDHAVLRAAGIHSILSLNGQLANSTPEHCGVDELTCFNLIDGKGNDPWLFEQAVKSIGFHASRRPNLLVHCQAGKSRSAMIVASHLVRQHGWDLRQGLDFIRDKRSVVLPADELIRMWDVNNEGRIE